MTRLEEEYFEWLTLQIHTPRSKSFNELFGRLHQYDFLWVIEGDDNRVQDGLDLRSEFSGKDSPRKKSDIISVLELLIGLSRRVAFLTNGAQEKWAWQLIKNLRLDRMSDPLTEQKSRIVDEALYSLVWRTYHTHRSKTHVPEF